jgi:SagB-type dehydrogenase family enzyme
VTVPGVSAPVHAYHDGTKHHFHQFARSLGYLDWASQPNPFRSFVGAPVVPLPPRPDASSQFAIHNLQSTIGEVLRHSLGLSAWKQFGASRWALRVNPSSGNLHPTEAYVIAGASPGLGDAPGVYHYAPDRHALERRCAFEAAPWQAAGMEPDSWLIALTSIHWREAWKYGERAFRYCQHDMGHAIAAIRIAASAAGCGARLLPEWSHADIAALTGIDRNEDYVEAEREDPGCAMIVRRSGFDVRRSPFDVRRSSSVVRSSLLAAVRAGQWTGEASQLSEDHTTWTFIDEIAGATRDPGRADPAHPAPSADPAPSAPPTYPTHLLLQRRSALSFDGTSSIDAATFLAMLSSVMPQPAPPWDALWWSSRIHLAIFVHRVDQIAPGLYLLARDRSAVDRLRAACGREFIWEHMGGSLPLYLLAAGDCRALARRLSCHQAIAADGFFSLAMIAEFDGSLQTFGPSFYRHLFWESGVVGQVLYLEAEAAGARATGIGCFYDDPVHDVLGIADHCFQSLYHFTVGTPVEDTRLTTERGYPWETGAES